MILNRAGSPNEADVCCHCKDVYPVASMRIWKPSNVLEIFSSQWICPTCEQEYAEEGITHADDRS